MNLNSLCPPPVAHPAVITEVEAVPADDTAIVSSGNSTLTSNGAIICWYGPSRAPSAMPTATELGGVSGIVKVALDL